MAKAETQRTGKSPRGNSWALVEIVAQKIAATPEFADYVDVVISADEYIRRAKKTGKTEAEIAKMSAAQLKEL